MSLMDDLEQVLAENWRVFRKHKPVGAYLPVGQLDGDCRECGGPWPCAEVRKVLSGHAFEAFEGMPGRCVAVVTRDGTGDVCRLPSDHWTHWVWQ